MALIGILLLIGIVKKNAIMMIDFALEAERSDGLSPAQAIEKACVLRFRPIMMTTMAALFGALPLAVGHGVGSEIRRPLGIAIVGGLIVSQALTLYTTPVIYLYLERLRLWVNRQRAARSAGRAASCAVGSPSATGDAMPVTGIGSDGMRPWRARLALAAMTLLARLCGGAGLSSGRKRR